MCPPTHSIAAMPTFESIDITTGIERTSPRPNEAASPSRVCVSRRPTSSIFTIRATAPYTPAVIASATSTRITARANSGSSVTSLSEITMISADRMKSVRIAPPTSASSCSGPCSLTGDSAVAGCGLIISHSFSAAS